MQETYIDIMIQSLKKKLAVLDELILLNGRQKEILEDNNGLASDFDEIVDRKSAIIDQLNSLDEGFDKLYERTKDMLNAHPDTYTEEIKTMKEYIRHIVDRSMKAQAQEARNKELMIQKAAKVKSKARQIRANAKATSNYYRNMSKVNYIDPQFLDNKK